MKEVLILIAILLVCIALKSRQNRIDKIDFLNNNVGNVNGAWIEMSNDELNQVYKVFALIKQGVKPNDSEYLLALDTLKKYNISI